MSENEIPLHSLTAEERSRVLGMGFDEAWAALEKEEPAVVALATEFILSYSEKAGVLLKEGKDYLDLLAPSPDIPAIERIARGIVLETLEEELDGQE
ncbi:hypothetical protein LJC46_03015 [Desulfovibrio sp. OttesenSCG-928-G15]|nr:hypothetical protein [Desulfovibrio sp. OttesenSCG-928-G15]